VVALSSSAHQFAPKGGIEFDNLTGERGYSPWRAYGQSKLANLLFAKELARRLAGTGKTANAVHPGVIMTNLGRSVASPMVALGKFVEPLFLKTIPQGAATQSFVATHPSLEKISGEYFVDCNIGKSSALSRDPVLAARLWDESERIVEQL
jgi:WW domain-containing oxidoreductase